MNRWWQVTCQKVGCRWKGGTRRGESRPQVTRFGCPVCGGPVNAAPTIGGGKTVMFPGRA